MVKPRTQVCNSIAVFLITSGAMRLVGAPSLFSVKIVIGVGEKYWLDACQLAGPSRRHFVLHGIRIAHARPGLSDMGSLPMLVFPAVASASLNGDRIRGKVQAVVSEQELLNLVSRRLSPKTPGEVDGSRNGGYVMLWTIFVVLLVLWLLGLVTSYTLYGYIHLLLVIAIVVLLIQLIQGRRAL